MNKKSSTYLKKGDTIQVIAGKEKGKTGEIAKILLNKKQIVVSGLNIEKKHIKPKKEGEIGNISQFEAPISISNVMLYSKEHNIRSRIVMQTNPDGTKTRILKKLINTN